MPDRAPSSSGKLPFVVNGPLRINLTEVAASVADLGTLVPITAALALVNGVDPVAALTLYDMGKAEDPAMRIEGLRLISKSGGKSGEWRAR